MTTKKTIDRATIDKYLSDSAASEGRSNPNIVVRASGQ